MYFQPIDCSSSIPREIAMTPAERTALAALDVFTSGEVERIRDLVTDDFVDHGLPPGVVPPGPDGYIATLRWLIDVLGIRYDVLRIRYEVHDVVAAGDKVAVRATAHGVHRSDHLGFAATGRPYAMPTMHLFRAEGDRLAEHWGVRDEYGVLVQVGAGPPPVLPTLPVGR
jgi:predicted ester cyclase